MAKSDIPPGCVAIVGASGRFPGAASVGELWRNLRAGVESITFFGDAELVAAGVNPRLLADRRYVKAYGWLDGIDLFDAAFFDVPPREAELLDPQQRLFLECAWEALEDAGRDPLRDGLAIGVFAGSGRNHYFLEHLLAERRAVDALGPVATMLANEKDFLATRTAYKLDLTGPSVAVQTACSTSLVAVHLACQSLLEGECDLVLAGGVSITHPSKEGYLYVDDGFFSPDGHLRAFDARAAGQVGGNGVAVVALRRLEDALADGDAIRAVIKGTALNNDGQRKVSYNAPGVEGQAAVIAEALAVAGVEPRSIGYVECHGTGTHLGDPIEVAALTEAFRARTHEKGFCAIGSLKTNVGHLDAAAGASGLIKAMLALQHGEIPPSLNYERPNPQIDFASSPFFVGAKLASWPRGPVPRRAGVSAFGMGGTNAHAILEEAPAQSSGPARRAEQLLLVSARTSAALEAASKRLAEHLASAAGESQPLADVAFTLEAGRRAFRHRRAVVASSHAEASRLLAGADKKRSAAGTAGSSARPVAFLFSGQGSQYAGMTRGLYESEPLFRTEVDRCSEQLARVMGKDPRKLLHPTPEERASAEKELERTENTQPCLFVVEWALARLLSSFGVEPSAMLGHSVGEYVAACLAGVFTLEEALALVAARGRLIGSLPAGGSMLAVHLPESEVERELSGSLALAAVNAPALCVVSGSDAELSLLADRLETREVSTRKLHTSHAFHSALMDPVLASFEAEVRKTRPQAPSRKVVSCTTGRWLTAAEARDPAYWVKHLRHPVRFADGVKTLASEGDPAFLEVGPGQALSTLAKLVLEPSSESRVATSTRHPQEELTDASVLLLGLGKLWSSGVEVDWSAVREGERRNRVPLPTYPFERKRYWIEKPRPSSAGTGEHAAAAAPALEVERKDPDIGRWFYLPSFKRSALPPALRSGARRWLVLAEEGAGLADELARRLARDGDTATVVRADAGSFDAEALVAGLEARGPLPDDFVHVRFADAAPADAGALAALGERAFFEPFDLARALAARPQAGEQRIHVVTSGTQSVLGEALVPEKALSLGVARAIALDVPGLRARVIDVEPALLRAGRALDDLVQELRARATEPVVAHRAGHRWLPAVEPVELDDERTPRAAALPRVLRPGMVVLVTGGLGGIGLSLAEGLARNVRAKLVLVGRSALPERAAWDAWVRERGTEDPTSRRIERLQRLEELGSEVFVVSADVADETALSAGLERARARFGPIQGLVHAAGVAGGGLLQLREPAAAAAVLRPKVRGTRVLERTLAREPLEFVALCSSLATVIDGPGQADYFAANAFLDAWASVRKGTPGPKVVSIGWDAWSSVGMAVETEIPEALRRAREESLRLGLAEDEGWDVFLRALSAPHPVLLVSTRDLERRRSRPAGAIAAAAAGDAAVGEAPAPDAGADGRFHERPALANAYVEPANALERELATLWSELLGIDRIGARDNFFELGGNSLLLMQVSTRLRARYDVALGMRELFDTPDVARLAERIESARLVAQVAHVHRPAPASASGDTEEFRL
jgi:acyl transferase domain-containing protein/acyl carrier protein